MDHLRRSVRASDNQDQYVLTVFLPILAVAIILCGAGCYYMERRRKRRIKEGKVKVDENLEGNLDAAESVISAASSKRRHYLLPTQTTGRLVRGGSIYGSTYGDPPPYERRRNEARSMSMRLPRDTYLDRMSNMEPERERQVNYTQSSGGYGGRPLSRSRSMVDVRHNKNGGGMGRSISSNNLDRFNDFDRSSPQNLYETTSRPGSVMSERRDAYRHDDKMDFARRHNERSAYSYNGSLDENTNSYGNHAKLGMRRSLSQPNLARLSSRQSNRGKYPHGILKKVPLSDDGRGTSNTANSSDSGIKDIYGETPLNIASLPRRVDSLGRPTSRAGMSSYGSMYEGYNNYNMHPARNHQPSYNAPMQQNSAYHQHQPTQESIHGQINHGYSHSFDQYQPRMYGANAGNNYPQHQMNGYNQHYGY